MYNLQPTKQDIINQLNRIRDTQLEYIGKLETLIDQVNLTIDENWQLISFLKSNHESAENTLSNIDWCINIQREFADEY